MKVVIKLFIFALLINPVLGVYGAIVRRTIVYCDVINRAFYDISSLSLNVVVLVLVLSMIICFVVTRLIGKIPLRWRNLVMVLFVLLLLFVQIPRCSLSPIFDGAGNDACGKVSIGNPLWTPFKGEVVLKTDPCSFVLVLITQCHDVRPYEIFNLSDIDGFVYNKNTQHDVRVRFRDLARDRLTLCSNRYVYDRVDVYICGEKRRQLPLEIDCFNGLKLSGPDRGSDMTKLLEEAQYKKLVKQTDYGYETHDLSRIKHLFKGR